MQTRCCMCGAEGARFPSPRLKNNRLCADCVEREREDRKRAIEKIKTTCQECGGKVLVCERIFSDENGPFKVGYICEPCATVIRKGG